MRVKLLFYSILFLLCQYSYADLYLKHSTRNAILYQDSISIFDKEKLESLKSDDNYNYQEQIEDTNWWTDFKEWLYQQLKDIFGDNLETNDFLRFLFKALPYIIVGLALIFIVWFIIKMNPGSQVMRQHNTSKVILTEEEELLMEKDLNQLAEDAIAQKEFRLAVRYLYLSCIKRLDMKRIIRYANEKTNYEYVKEIKFSEVALQFKSLTFTYEQIWYGQMVFDEVFFQKYRERYNKFHRLLDQKQYAKT